MAIRSTRLTTTNPTQVFEAAGQQAITVIYICNTSGSDVGVNVNVINSDDSTASSVDNIIYSDLVITSNDTYVMMDEKLILDNLNEIEMTANVSNAVTVTVSSIAV